MASDVEKLAAWEAARLLMHQTPTNAPKWWMEVAGNAARSIYSAFGNPPDPITSTGGNYFTQPAASGEVVAWQWRLRGVDTDLEWVTRSRPLPDTITNDPACEVRHLYATPQPDADTVRDADGWTVSRYTDRDGVVGIWAKSPNGSRIWLAAIDSAIKGEKS